MLLSFGGGFSSLFSPSPFSQLDSGKRNKKKGGNRAILMSFDDFIIQCGGVSTECARVVEENEEKEERVDEWMSDLI